jgi:hypothetical protein
LIKKDRGDAFLVEIIELIFIEYSRHNIGRRNLVKAKTTEYRQTKKSVS